MTASRAKTAAIIHQWCCLGPCHIKCRHDVHAGDVHRVFFAAVPDVLAPVFLPLPMFLSQLRNHHLDVLAADAFNSSHVQLFPLFQVDFPFSTCEKVAYHFDNTDVSAVALCFSPIRRRRPGPACEANNNQHWSVTHRQHSPRECPKKLKKTPPLKKLQKAQRHRGHCATRKREQTHRATPYANTPAQNCSATCAPDFHDLLTKPLRNFVHAEPNQH